MSDPFALGSRPARRAAVALVLALPVAVVHRMAWALCPNCLGQGKSWSAKQELLGLFLLIPFGVAWLAARLIRRHLPAPHDASGTLDEPAAQRERPRRVP